MNYDEWKANDSLWFQPEPTEMEELLTYSKRRGKMEDETETLVVKEDRVMLERVKESGEVTPRYPVHCRKCGFAGEQVVFPTSLAKVKAALVTATYKLTVICPCCKRTIDSIEITAIFNGVSNWMVGKKHVG